MSTVKQSSYGDEGTIYPGWSLLLRRAQIVCGLLGAAATVGLHGGYGLSAELERIFNVTVLLALALPVGMQALRYQWSRARSSFLRDNRLDLGVTAVWLGGLAVIPLSVQLGLLHESFGGLGTLCLVWSQWITVARGAQELYVGIHQAADAGLNPALVLVLSFASLIAVGTILLTFPRCRPVGEPAAPFLKALFTATSASCVTGLTLDPTGTYWSRSGQLVILGLIQLGGLGIMTFSAFFAFVLGRRLPVREQMTFRELLDSDRIGDVASMIRAILTLTLGIELVGAILMMTLWPELPWRERVFFGVFHSISAFCNAGFCLRPEGFLGWETRWQVCGLVPLLIILGGLGFTVIDNWRRVLRYRWFEHRSFGTTATAPTRLSLSTRMVTTTTLLLLAVGTVAMFLFEYDNPRFPDDPSHQWANAWFHSVTLRTAGFNTVNHEDLRPATKLLGIAFMFVGASPGSTGGGVKTICLALMFLTLRSVLRGRGAVETNGRTIPDELVFRGLAIITIGLGTLMVSSLLLVMIENHPERLIDQLYEAASAFGTVGLSANLTHTLKPASLVVLIVTMFLGRVGPLTLIVALAGFNRPRGYAYPEERISLS